MGGQPESQLSLKIQKALKQRGAYVWKVHGNEYTPAGTPDIVGAFLGQAIAFETKMPGNKLSAIQEYRIEKMREAGFLIVAPCYTISQAVSLIDLMQQLADHNNRPGPGRPSIHTEYMQTRKGYEFQLTKLYGREAVFPS